MSGQYTQGTPYSSLTAPGSRLVTVIWAVLGIMTLAVFTTYGRLPVTEFYNVSRSGLEGGASRALTFLNFPVAFIAIALIGFVVARLYVNAAVLSRSAVIILGTLASLALVLSLVASFPGVVDPGNVDARPINAVPAIGVVLAIILTVASIRMVGSGESLSWAPFDRFRVGITAFAIFLSLPWILADFGFYIADVPLLGSIFMSREIPAGETLRAVHLGDHHGINGVMYLLAGLWLSRELFAIRPEALRWSLAAYLSLMMAYGSFIAAQDFWLEQIVKRGWTTVEIPNALQPALSREWGLIALTTIILTLVLIRFSDQGEGTTEEVGRETLASNEGRTNVRA